ncbi:EAL domain-containing protein [Brevibacillus ruminantium]|uniref:EAL domain-containing protein n=1 Tax=Brevibacillus ruminantium TaxID=2950604 RepID=A0ABY4WP99_9BACL|nr:EAL domain-containing protein [Brevibacillus ruminantium]USG67690.1 EAL domain-containing protein [Brevibacillus ruminantium]
MESITEVIENKQFYHVFQPICHLPEKKVIGYEALIRSLSPIGPEALFQKAIEQNRLFELDTFSILHALQTFFVSHQRQDKSVFLFVNIYPSTIVEDQFPAFVDNILSRFRPFLSKIVLEINESAAERKIWMNPLFTRRIGMLRKIGFMIALDDVGEGTTSFRKIVEISPDFIKMDKFFADGLEASVKKQKIVRLLVEYCQGEAELILEGIEHATDFSRAAVLGVTMGQGYYLGKPERLKSYT